MKRDAKPDFPMFRKAEPGIRHKKHEISQKHQVERAVPARLERAGTARSTFSCQDRLYEPIQRRTPQSRQTSF
jgi:hypothetical protein